MPGKFISRTEPNLCHFLDLSEHNFFLGTTRRRTIWQSRLCRQKPPNSGKTIPEACPSDQEAWPAAGRRFAMLGKYRSQLVAICVYPVFTRLFANDQQETTKKPTRHRLENTIRSSEHRPRLALRARTTATTRTTTRRPPRNLQETQRNHQQTTRTAFWQRGILLQRHDSSLPETVRP